MLKQEGYRIIYLDECGLTTKTILMTDYTNVKQKHQLPLVKVSQPVYSLILAISEENGLEHCKMYTRSVDVQRFSEYLDELYVQNKHEKIAVLMDNLRAHKTDAIIRQMDELGIKPIYNVPYQPDLNPTEACFSKIKNHYRRRKLNMLVNDDGFDAEQLVWESVNVLTR